MSWKLLEATRERLHGLPPITGGGNTSTSPDTRSDQAEEGVFDRAALVSVYRERLALPWEGKGMSYSRLRGECTTMNAFPHVFTKACCYPCSHSHLSHVPVSQC